MDGHGHGAWAAEWIEQDRAGQVVANEEETMAHHQPRRHPRRVGRITSRGKAAVQATSRGKVRSGWV